MSHPWQHATSSSHRFGGKPEDYLAIHDWFDETKAYFCDPRHRALRHHSEGIFECERVFGTTITNSEGRKVPVRLIGEQHVIEDCGHPIPSAADWLRHITLRPWMRSAAQPPEAADMRRLLSDDAQAPDAGTGTDPALG